ncbi:alpha/beta fold hydrolase [Agrococcus jejuensis]|uniref:Pimeloyl-ACP methyl ester carboxylesterase n=1 Tax=Agrococcus jejuensis TaxID=399736 RepID=A0A1G8G7T3_9MICO|nr:alpha/beta hydrolase [Agrococcus jejuensis]SDH90447.1 Pimeloyl-ACP methyl ester carboxylesterase [Agrococcus jejuensis]
MADGTRLGRRSWRVENRGRDGGVRSEHRFGEDVVVAWTWHAGHERTVVLVHGIGMGQQYFGLLRAELAKTFDVVAVDLPGFGESPEPTKAASMEECGAIVGGVIRDLRLAPVVAVGHSMGTQVVSELTAQHPELVDALVLIAPTVDRKRRSKRTQSARLLLDLVNDPPIVGLVGLRMYAQAGPRWFLKQFDMMLAHRLETIAPRIQRPTLVIRGSRDVVCPRRWVREIAGLIPDATFREAKGKGHEAMITGAEPVADMIAEFVAARSED